MSEIPLIHTFYDVRCDNKDDVGGVNGVRCRLSTKMMFFGGTCNG